MILSSCCFCFLRGQGYLWQLVYFRVSNLVFHKILQFLVKETVSIKRKLHALIEIEEGVQDCSCCFLVLCHVKVPCGCSQAQLDYSYNLKWFPAVLRSIYLFYHITDNNKGDLAACLPGCVQGTTLSFCSADSVDSLHYIIPGR